MNKKKTGRLLILSAMLVASVGVSFMLSGCSKKVELVVATSYAGTDGNQVNFQTAYEAWEADTGHTVIDESNSVNEEWKASILDSFEDGTEPDVLFYFVGNDADDLIAEGKVVSIETIQEEYPEYASNMKADLLPESTYDGEKYTIPVNGYWEGLYVNEEVIEAAGVEVPDKDYTWDEFLEDCQKIADAGYTPIAVSLEEVPHYWFEFLVYNQGAVANHTELPSDSDDEVALKWVAGLDSLKDLYEFGFLPEDTLSITDEEAVQMLLNDEAAFLIDGSWKISYFAENADDIENFSVTYVPGDNERNATDIIGGLSMGYYITTKAWEDEDIRDAAVSFVMAMTTDEVVSSFGQTAVTALSNGVISSSEMNGLELSAISMTAGATGVSAATQDGLSTEERTELFASIPDIVTGKLTALEAIEAALFE